MKKASADASPPYLVIYTDVAEAEYDAIYTGFASRNFEAAERWSTRLREALALRASEHANVAGRRYVPDDAHRYPGRDARFARVGAWRVLYDLIDDDDDGLPDTLRVIHFRPAAQNEPINEPANE